MTGTPEDMEVETPMHPLQIQYNEAEELIEDNPDRAIKEFDSILKYEGKDNALEDVQRVKEHAIYKLGQLYTKHGRQQELSCLLQSVRPFFLTIPKAKTGKIVRTVIDMVSRTGGPESLKLQADLCHDSIAWCNQEKHTFLRQRVEARLAEILFDQLKFQPALDLITRLLREIKKLDDKQLLVEIHLIESKLHHALRNTPKARAALTAARSVANSIYVVPKVQAQIDMMSGTLHAEERDYKTSYSYFFEAFEAYNQLNDSKALPCLKYMLLSKVASGDSQDVQGIVNGKQGMKYSGIEVDALVAVSKAHQERSLEKFKETTERFKSQLSDDALITRHLDQLYEALMDANLLKIIEPFSCVEVAHVAKLIKLPLKQIETKLSQLILDGKFYGILDQGKGQLIVYDDPQEDQTYVSGLALIDHVEHVVGSLFQRADHITA